MTNNNLSFGNLLKIRESVGTKRFSAFLKKERSGTGKLKEEEEEAAQLQEQDQSESESESGSGSESDEEEGSLNSAKRKTGATTNAGAGAGIPVEGRTKGGRPQKRGDKNMPSEVTSKKPVTRKRNIMALSSNADGGKTAFRDPRFEPLSGHLNPELFKRSYGFLHEYQENEINLIKAEIKKEKDLERKGELVTTMSALVSRINARKQKEVTAEKKRTWKKKEGELVKEGKTPYFVKKSEMKKTELYDKYKALGSGVNLEKHLEKRRKRNSQRDRTRIPTSRRSSSIA